MRFISFFFNFLILPIIFIMFCAQNNLFVHDYKLPILCKDVRDNGACEVLWILVQLSRTIADLSVWVKFDTYLEFDKILFDLNPGLDSDNMVKRQK